MVDQGGLGVWQNFLHGVCLMWLYTDALAFRSCQCDVCQKKDPSTARQSRFYRFISNAANALRCCHVNL